MVAAFSIVCKCVSGFDVYSLRLINNVFAHIFQADKLVIYVFISGYSVSIAALAVSLVIFFSFR